MSPDCTPYGSTFVRTFSQATAHHARSVVTSSKSRTGERAAERLSSPTNCTSTLSSSGEARGRSRSRLLGSTASTISQ